MKLLTGRTALKEPVKDLPEEVLLLCEVIDNPYLLPFYIETFYRMKIADEEAFRFSLIRVQIDSDLRVNEDIQKHQQRKYVVRTIEKLLYSDLLLEDIHELILESE
ncbi:MAG: hypothetical protein AWU59_1938 [Methanolobus sp. T82-4]|nr:MAG: hypothetical protein AWU59_1938 [Methanolobus sp. T82-4]